MKPIDFYAENIMSRYEAKIALEHRELLAVEMIRGLRLDNAAVLDVGCGDGFFLNHLAGVLTAGNRYYGLDYSTHRIRVARKTYSFQFDTCNLEVGIPFADATLDLVYAGEVIEHLYNPDLFLSEISRVLKVDGHVVVSTPNLNSWINRVLFLMGYQPLHVECSTKSSLYGFGFMKRFKKQHWPIGHVRVFNRRSLYDAMRANEFAVLACKGTVFEFMPGPLKPLDRLFAYLPGLASGLVVQARKTG